MIFVWFLIVNLFSPAKGYTGCDDLISIDDDQFSASSSLNDDFLPAKAKLDGSGAWCALGGNEDTLLYLQIKFKKMTNVVKIVTQGRRDQQQWTQTYRLKFSQDGTTFGDILSTYGSTLYFDGNSNDYSKVYNNLPYPVTMKYLRLYIVNHWNQPCIRIGVYGCDALTSNVCDSYLLPNVANDKLTAISNYNSDLDTTHSRLDSVNAWCPSSSHFSAGYMYIQVDFSQLTNVIGIATKGRTDALSYVQSYYVKFSQDGTNWLYVFMDDGREKMMRGNWDQNTAMVSKFDHVLPVKYLRIYPERYYNEPCLRFDVIGCNAPSALSCSEYLVSGVDSVPDDKMTASSYYSSDYLPSYARIYTDTYWCPDSYDTSTAYFQVQFQRKKKVSGFLTKGPPNNYWFMVLFSISYSNDGGNTWQYIKNDDGKTRIFFGNKDMYSTMLNMLDTPIEVEMIRFNTKHIYDRPCGSFEVLGCNSVPEVRTGFYGHFIPMKVDSTLTPHLVWTKKGTMFNCIHQCSEDSTCVSFAFNNNDQVCKGFSVQYYRNDNKSPDYSEDMYFIDRSLLDQYGYTLSESSMLCYKIFTSGATHSDAEKQCQDQKTYLLPIRSDEQLQEIQGIIERNSHVINAGIHVDGTFVSLSTTWQYHDNITMNDALWSASGNNSANGHCTSVTKDGLVATDCGSKLFFACGL